MQDWLDSLKPHEHSYSNSTEIVVLEPTHLKDGLAYQLCDDCKEPALVVVDKIVDLNYVEYIAETGTADVANDEEYLYIGIQKITSAGRLALTFTDSEGVAIPADAIETEYFFTYENDDTVYPMVTEYSDLLRAYQEGYRAIVRVKCDPSYANLKVTPQITALDAKFDHKITVQAYDGTAGGATKVKATQPGRFAWMGNEVVAEAEIVDGVATLNMVPGIYTIEIEGLGESYLYTEQIKTTLPNDGSNDMGSDYTIDLVVQHSYTFTVKKGDTLIEGVDVEIYAANTFDSEGNPSSYSGTASYKGTTYSNGQTYIDIQQGEYYIAGEDKINFLYQASVRGDLGFAGTVVPVVLDPSSDEKNIVFEIVESYTELSVDAAPAAIAFAVSDQNQSSAFIKVADSVEAKKYTLMLDGIMRMGSYKLIVNGEQVASATASSTSVEFAVELKAGDEVEIQANVVKSLPDATATLKVWVEPVLIVDDQVEMKAKTQYSFTSENGGKYVATFTLDKDNDGYGEVFASADDWDYMGSNKLFAIGNGMVGDSQEYEFTLEANGTVTFWAIDGLSVFLEEVVE